MRITITNDGATILKSVPVDNPAAKVLVEIAKTQDDTVGDGTTSVAVLCGELLREAEFLVNQRVHPMTIMAGWRQVNKLFPSSHKPIHFSIFLFFCLPNLRQKIKSCFDIITNLRVFDRS